MSVVDRTRSVAYRANRLPKEVLSPFGAGPSVTQPLLSWTETGPSLHPKPRSTVVDPNQVHRLSSQFRRAPSHICLGPNMSVAAPSQVRRIPRRVPSSIETDPLSIGTGPSRQGGPARELSRAPARARARAPTLRARRR